MNTESIFKQNEHQAHSTIACGSLDPQEWAKLGFFENRNHLQDLSKEKLKDIIMDTDCKHPFQRFLIRVDSDVFNWAVKIVTGEIIKAKRNKKGVMHLECCNIIWIGSKPRQ